ncbi:MAG TPA: LytTR family DNA-binding domain-containing protein, partial [Flavisolibacter sp.]
KSFMIRTVIIDDEPSAVRLLQLVLETKCSRDIEIIAVSNDPFEGKLLLQELKPELVFLDVQMPGMTGIEIIRSLVNPSFQVVFVTAFDRYALDAFRVSAVDYLLKPLEEVEIMRAVDKVKQNIMRNAGISDRVEKLVKAYQPPSLDENIGIAMADRIVFVRVNELTYCEAKGPYTTLYMDDGQKLVASRPLGDFEAQLSGRNFFRIHHSLLINLNKIREYQRNDGGYVLMRNNKKLEVSQRRRRDFLQAVSAIVV